MSDSLANVSQLIQSPLVDRTNSIGRINDDAFARVSGAQLDDTQGREPDITTPPLQEEFFNFVQEQQDFQDFLDDELLEEDILRAQEALQTYQDIVDQRSEDIEAGNEVDVRG